MRGYLLDVNHVSAHFNKNKAFLERYRKVPHDVQWRICAITLGEIQASHEMSVSTDQHRRDDYATFVIDEYVHNALDITATTRIYFAKIMGRIWRKHPPPSRNKGTDRHLVDCGVDMNDLWLASCAFEHGLTLLTQDDMSCIREVVNEEEVKFDCWI